MDSAVLREKVKKARRLVEEYSSKKIRLEVLIQSSKESTSTNEKGILLIWIDSVSKWLENNKEDYERALVFSKIPESDLEQLEACDRALYGG